MIQLKFTSGSDKRQQQCQLSGFHSILWAPNASLLRLSLPKFVPCFEDVWIISGFLSIFHGVWFTWYDWSIIEFIIVYICLYSRYTLQFRWSWSCFTIWSRSAVRPLFRWSPGSGRVVNLQFQRFLCLGVFTGLGVDRAKTMEKWWKGPRTSRNYMEAESWDHQKTFKGTLFYDLLRSLLDGRHRYTRDPTAPKEATKVDHWSTPQRLPQLWFHPSDPSNPLEPKPIQHPIFPFKTLQKKTACHDRPWHSGRGQIRQPWQLSAVQPFCSSTWTLAMRGSARQCARKSWAFARQKQCLLRKNHFYPCLRFLWIWEHSDYDALFERLFGITSPLCSCYELAGFVACWRIRCCARVLGKLKFQRPVQEDRDFAVNPVSPMSEILSWSSSFIIIYNHL